MRLCEGRLCSDLQARCRGLLSDCGFHALFSASSASSAMPQFAANLSMLYPELTFLDRFAAAARDGFKAVEFLFCLLYTSPSPRDS